jgi:Secretion system C-terminal sorting domain
MKKIFLLTFLVIVFLFRAQTSNSNIDTLYVSPNPCDTSTTIYFTIFQTDTVSLNVYNRWGTPIKSFFQKTILPSGSYSIYFNTDSLDTNTIYFVVLKVDTFQKAYKLLRSASILNLDSKRKIDNKINVYPNPFFNYLFINSSDKKSVTVMDLNGKIVYANNETGKAIDLSSISIGTYILTLYNEKKELLLRQKIVKRE